jgi:hypothetical protein
MGDQACSESAAEDEQKAGSVKQNATESHSFEEINVDAFMSTFLNIDSQLETTCEQIFSLQEGSDVPLEWQREVKEAIQHYHSVQGEIGQYEPFLRIITLVLERAGMKQFTSTFPRFMTFLEFAVQCRETHEEGQADLLVPEILGSAAIKGIREKTMSWGRALFPLVVATDEIRKPDPLLREIALDNEKILQFKSMEKPEASEPEYDLKSMGELRTW